MQAYFRKLNSTVELDGLARRTSAYEENVVLHGQATVGHLSIFRLLINLPSMS